MVVDLPFRFPLKAFAPRESAGGEGLKMPWKGSCRNGALAGEGEATAAVGVSEEEGSRTRTRSRRSQRARSGGEKALASLMVAWLFLHRAVEDTGIR